MMTTTTYGFRAEEERMEAADERADERMRLRTYVWNALAPIKDSQYRETAYDALESEVECATFHDGWLQIGTYIVGVLDDEFTPVVAVYEMTPEERGLIGVKYLAQRPGEIGADGFFGVTECIGDALCRIVMRDNKVVFKIAEV